MIRMRRKVALIAVLLIMGGAVVNVAVAWSCRPPCAADSASSAACA